MKKGSDYVDTSGTLARAACVTVPTVTLYSKLGLLDFVVSSNGTRLYRGGQAEKVRQILAKRLAARGRRVESAVA